MSLLPSDIPTVDHYALHLRQGLKEAARVSLIELEQSINSVGFGWMDAYMESILERNHDAPIAELMKTPSRTQGTSKKTRANTAAAKERFEKVKGLNARLALSPLSSSKQPTSSRMPLSPLQPRSLNTAQPSPVLVASPKGKQKGKAEKPPAKPKAKRGKAKKVPETNENQNEDITPSTQADDSIPSTSSSSHTHSEKGQSKSDASTKKSTRSKKTVKVDVVQESAPVESMAVDETVIEAQPPHKHQSESVDEAVIPPRPTTPHVEKTKDLSTVTEQEETSGTNSIVPAAAELDAKGDIIVETQGPQPASSVEPENQQLSSEPAEVIEVDYTDPITDTVVAESAVPAQAAPIPSVLVRQVRSSWLSKALGTGTVPVSGMPATTEPSAALRKSYAAPAQQRQSVALDFTGLRKSLAPIGGLKRKSGDNLEVESDDEEKRPEKVTKFAPGPSQSVKPVETATTQVLPSRTPGPVSRPALPAKTPSFGIASIAPDSQTRASGPSSATQADSHRSDIHKVTKALDELRERAAAKEIAKQKAALAASTGPPRVPQAKSTGTGFLRGLGSIGAGLLGMGGSAAEEEADRLAMELEADRKAEEALEELLRNAVKADTEMKEDEKAKEAAASEKRVEAAQPNKSTTPGVAGKVDHAEHIPTSPQHEEEDELVEEQSVMEDLLPEEAMVPEEQEPESTTPTGTPTRPTPARVEAPCPQDKVQTDVQELSAVPMKAKTDPPPQPEREEVQITIEQAPTQLDENLDMDMHDQLDDEEIEDVEPPRPKSSRAAESNKTHGKMPSSTSSNLLAISTSSVSTTAGGFGQAQTMAAKALGVKPAAGPVKSIALAAAAAKKEQATAERKSMMKDQAEHRKAEIARKKAEEDRVKADMERRAKVAELEEKRRQRAEHEKRKKERDEKMALIAKEKAAKEEREAQAAKAKAAEEEATRKRKLAASLNKSQNAPAAKRVANPAQVASSTASKGKEPFRPTKQGGASNPLTASTSGQKMGPTAFRTAPHESNYSQQQSSSGTITLVSQQQQQQTAERKVLGPPSRPSAMAMTNHHATASTVLQQSRVALQSQLDEKAALVQSEDIVLPDIASEYSDSDDEDRTRDFQRPAWAESPELRAALEAQAHRDPDELFGPIKPLNMEELFKVHKGKFRARTSSANWARGDGLTKAEEVEYARRMGFKGSNLGKEAL